MIPTTPSSRPQGWNLGRDPLTGRWKPAAWDLDNAEIVSRYQTGTPIYKLARAFGSSPDPIRNRLLTAGVPLCSSSPRPRPAYARIMARTEVVDRGHVSDCWLCSLGGSGQRYAYVVVSRLHQGD
jgi:hypothetical protein